MQHFKKKNAEFACIAHFETAVITAESLALLNIKNQTRTSKQAKTSRVRCDIFVETTGEYTM